jgi:hypothetical protein
MLEVPLAFDWVAENSAGVSTALQPGPDGGLFDFAVSPNVSGQLLQQLQLLPERASQSDPNGWQNHKTSPITLH